MKVATRGLCFALILIGFAIEGNSARAASAANVYIAQAAAGSNNGSSCSNAYAAAFFNNAANWGSGPNQIGPGTVVYLCGTITTELVFQGSGTSGNTITVQATNGAKLSQASGNLVDINGQAYLTVDGGSNGIIENTLNGSAGGTCPGGPCQFQNNISAIYAADGTFHDVEIKNWTIQNIYVHSLSSDTTPSNVLENAVYASNVGGVFSFHNNIVHDGSWLLRFDSFNGAATLQIYDNNFYNNDHDVAIGGTNGPTFTAFIHDNISGSKVNWDAGTTYHHDGVHITPYASGCSGLYIYNNVFEGNWGNAATANIYMEVQLPNVYIFNNIALWQNASNLTNGQFNLDMTNGGVYNNTFIADSTMPYNGSCLTVTGSGMNIENNAFSGCNQYLSVDGSSSSVGTVDYNIYGNHGAGGGNGWYWQTSGPPNFASWQAVCGCDSHSASYGASPIGIEPFGVPLANSYVIAAATNLMSLATGYLQPLASDTSAGNTRTPVSRPATGPWDTGAYAYVGQGDPPLPPTNLSATPQ